VDMVRQIRREDLSKEFRRIMSGNRMFQSLLGGYMPYEHEWKDDSYFLSEEQLKSCLGIAQVHENE